MHARRRSTSRYILPLIILILLLATAVMLLFRRGSIKNLIDPHEGQVYIYDGYDWVWMTPLEGIEVNTLTADDFTEADGRIVYTGNDYTTRCGIDVSEHQHSIDWNSVKADGVDYAYIRVGRRGYTEGGIFEDEYFEQNIKGALNAGLDVGVYFFSQAINASEALEEAQFVLDHISGYDISLPVMFDWEPVESDSGARTDDLSREYATGCAIAFCEKIRLSGYEAGVYFNRTSGYYRFDLSKLTNYSWWFSLPEMGYPSFYYAVDMWQYSFTDAVNGIEGETDMNMILTPIPHEEADTEA